MAGAERKRRYRDRLRRGAMVVPVEVDPADSMALVDSGLISTSEVEDRDAIGRVDAVESDTLARDLDCVTVNDTRLAGDLGEDRNRK